MIVSLKRTPTAAERAALGLGATSRIRGDRLLLAAVPEGLTTSEFAARLADSAIVAYAEPDYLLTPAVAPYSSYPNDTYFRDETAWGFTELTGARTSIPHAKSWGLRGAGSANFDEVWPALATDKAGPGHPQDVRVAVIDTGFYFDGYTDMGETANIRAAIDECATYTPGPSSRNTTDTDVTPVSADVTGTTTAHGTMVASEIGQGTSNYVGSSGAAWDTDVDIYKIQGVAGATYGSVHKGDIVMPDSALVKAIYDAVDDAHAKGYRLVINMSFVENSGSPGSTSVRDAIAYARRPDHDAVVVAAAGNDGNPVVSYPAAYEGVISVGAYAVDKPSGGDLAIGRSWFSNYGTQLDILAPGSHIWGPIMPGVLLDPANPQDAGYWWWDGTSMAAPYVSSAAALLLRIEPSLTATEVETYLTHNAVDMGAPGRDNSTGWGRLDAYAAYLALTTPHTIANLRLAYADDSTMTLSVTDRDSGASVTTYFSLDGDLVEGRTVTFHRTFNPRGIESPWHTLKYWSVDSNGVAEQAQPEWMFKVLEPDLLAPETSSDATSTYAGSATLHLSAEDPEPGWPEDEFPLTTHHRLDSGSDTTGTTVIAESSGPHTLRYWSVDYAGNLGPMTVATFTVVPVPPSTGSPSIPAAISTRSTNRPFTVSGEIVRHAAGTHPVTLQFYRYQSGRWVLRKSVSAAVSDTLSFSTYRASTSLPYSGTWRVRARHKVGTKYLYSGYRTFTVVATPSSKGAPSAPSPPSKVTHNRSFSVSGYVVRDMAGTAPVKLYLYRYESRRWVLRKVGYASVSDFLTFSKYLGSTSVPYPGRWRVKARHLDGSASHTSGYRYFTAS